MRRKMSVPIFCRWHVQRSDGRQSHYFFIASSHTIHVSLSHLRFSISSFFYHFGWYYQAMTSRAFWLRVGFGSGLTKKFGFRYCAYYSLKANSLVILCNSILSKGTELTGECFVIQIMLRKNWNIITTYSSLQPIAMPPVQKNSVVPKKQASKVWRYLGHNLDGAIAKCLLWD